MFRNLFMRMSPEGEVAAAGGEVTPVMVNHELQTKPETQATTTETTEVVAPIHIGLGGEIKTVDELKAYAKKLEDDAAKRFLEGRRDEANPKTSTQDYLRVAPAAEELNAEEMLENPAAFAQKLEARITKGIEARKEAEQRDRQFWDSFYLEHPQLKKFDRAVKSVLTEKWGVIQQMDVTKGKEVLARESMTYLKEIQGTQGTTVTMTQEPGPTLHGSFPSAGKVETAKKRSTFLDEVNEARRKKKS